MKVVDTERLKDDAAYKILLVRTDRARSIFVLERGCNIRLPTIIP